MAGLKETPRQKMVGMMYLVLTALLALQVDNTVLEKFLLIDSSLQQAVEASRADSRKIRNGMEEAVSKRGNKADERAIIQKADQALAATDVLMKEINGLRMEIIKSTGGKDESGNYKNAHSYDQVMTLMLGPGESKNGKAYQLKKMLNDYSRDMSKLDTGLHFLPIALDASEMAVFKNDENQRSKDFAQVNFDHTPMTAALAVLSQMQTEVAKMENQALEALAQRVGANDFKFDRVFPVISPESRYVTAGTPYKARMYVSAASSQAHPLMSSSAGQVKVNNQGEGSLEFIAQAGDYDASGKAKRVWRGSITLKTPRGDTTFTVEEEYYVVKPTIQVQAANVQALYLNCGNELNIQVPELGSSYEPQFVVSGAEAINAKERGRVTLVPNARLVEVTVKNKGAVIGKQSFRVKLLPKPSLVLKSGGRPLNLKNGGAMIRNLSVEAIPDSDLKEFLPKDARYRVSKWTVSLARGRKEVAKVENSNDLSELAQKAQPGDRLVVEVKQVQRMNFKNAVEEVNLGEQIFIYSIN